MVADKASERLDGQRLRTRILATGALVISALVGSAVYDAWRLHEQLQISNRRALGNLARALANEAKRNFESVDLLLRDTADWYEDAAGKLSQEQIQQELSARASGLAQISVLTVVDAHGVQRLRSRDTGEPLANVSDRAYFQAQREVPSGGLFINEPIVTRTEKIPSLVISRRVNGPHGAFAGVVAAIVTLYEFQDMYSTLQLNEGSALILALDDGTLVARHPPADGAENRPKFPELAVLKGGELVDRAISPVDGRPKLIAALPVGNQPLIIAMTRDEEISLRPWYDEVQSAAIRTALLLLLIVFTIHRLLRQLKKVALGEQALRESEERYALTMDAAEGGHAEWNIANGTTFVSDKWRALHGIEADADVSTIRALVAAFRTHEEDRPGTLHAIEQHMAGLTPSIEVEYRTHHGGDQWRWIHARAKTLLNDRGEAARIFWAATDVTERREALASKLALERRLQQTQRLESLGTLAGGIAHDFNNILGAILGFGEMAQQQTQPGSAMHRHLSRVMQAGDRARLLVRRILDFSRSGVAEHVPVHIQSVVEEALAMLAPSLPSGVVLKTELAVGNAAVNGDTTQLYQVAMNLCTNALQAMGNPDSRGGVLTVRLQQHDLTATKTLLHGSLSPGRYACLEVADTGTGIEADVLLAMFNPFFTTKKGSEGTGLGLSVVHGVVTDHGGGIDVVSQLGVGTTVSVWLPVVGTCEAVRSTSTVPVQMARGRGQTIMIVDDEVALVELAEELLARLGYEPVGFHTAEAALAAFEAAPNRFDAVLTDEMLPAMPGSALAQRLLDLRPGVPIVVMSGKITAELDAQVAALGLRGLLHKPLQLGEIAQALARVMAFDSVTTGVTFIKQA